MAVKANWNDLLSHLAHSRWSIWWLLLLAGILRGILFWMHIHDGIKDADEAMMGLMALHIAKGSDFPLIWYGQHYMGTLPSWISAAMFAITGISSNVLRIVPLLLSMGVVAMVYKLGTDLFERPVGLLSGLWIAVCPPFVATFCLKQANYMFTLLIGTAVLWLTHQICWAALTIRQRHILIALSGGLTGLGIWVHMQILPYVAAALGYVLWKARQRLTWTGALLFISALAIGISPLILANFWHQSDSLLFFLDSFQQSNHQTASPMGSRIYNCLVVSLPALLSGTPFWSFHWAGFAWSLDPVLDNAVFISALMLILTLLTGVCIVMGWQQRVLLRPKSRLWGARARKAILLGSVPVAVLLLFVYGLFGRYLVELLPLLAHDAIRWSQFEGAPVLTPTFLVYEICSPAMLIYLLYIPALLYSRCVWRYHHSKRRAIELLLLTLLLTIGSYMGTRYGDARSPRYLMPVCSVVPILLALLTVALMRRLKLVGILLMISVLAIHIFGFLEIPTAYHVQPAQYINWWNPEQNQLVPLSNRPLIKFLQTHRIGHVYAKYWLGLPIIFDSEETILASAGRAGRYPRYDDQVAQAERVAYVFHRNGFEWQRFEQLVRKAGISYQREPISEYVVYSEVALPDRLNSPLWPEIVGLLQYP